MKRRDVLAELVKSKQLSQDGKDWLTLALDPFHDYNHQIAGYPDSDGSQTVVACYEYQYNLEAPVGTNTTWDAHIYTSPNTSPEATQVGQFGNGWATFTQLAGEPQCVMGALTIYASPSGGPLVPGIAPGPVTQVPLPGNTDLAFGMSRVVGMGFEVHNTTAEMHKQGSVTVYRMPNQGNLMQTVVSNNAGTYRASYVGHNFRLPPTQPQTAMLLKGTMTWEAKDGCYVVPTLSSINNPIRGLSTIGAIHTGSGGGDATNACAAPWVTVNGQAAPAASLLTPQLRKNSNVDTSGAFFTGLSAETTLRIVLKVYVERAPTSTESSLAVVATPSAAYDVAALELYSKAMSVLPVAAKVGENAKGDWWRAVLRVLSEAAVPLSMLATPFFPAAPAVGAAVATGSRIALGEAAKRPDNTKQAVQVAKGGQPQQQNQKRKNKSK